MSDFFGDDFTAELKGYFLDSLLKEVENFVDLVDSTTFKKIKIEVKEQSAAWTVDARSNDFLHLATWLEEFREKLEDFEEDHSLKSSLQQLKKYLDALQVDKKDSAELSTHFAFAAKSHKQALYLHCKSGTQSFVVSIQNVLEISSSLPLFPLPDNKPGLLGIIPFRGEAIPVYNLVEYGFPKQESQHYYYVICEFEGARFSLQVTETDDMVSLGDKELQSIESHSSMIAVPFITNFFIKDQHTVMVLDLEKLVAA